MSQAPHPDHRRWPALHGGLAALFAALLFGASTPLVQRFGAGLGTFVTAALLYAGAALTGALLQRSVVREARVRRDDRKVLVAMAFFGAMVGPVALVWGLQRTSGTSASLMLSLEAVATALLARLWYGETMDRRVILAMSLITLGGMALIADRAGASGDQALGLVAVVVATIAWGIDNTLSRAVSSRDPGQVVMLKSGLGALATVLLARAFGEPLPGLRDGLAIGVIGATGYGLSLRFYLLAQRAFGAGRAASVFAFAPLIGAAIAWAMGERGASAWMSGGALLMVVGLVLHLSERHAHGHRHDAMEHEHAHRHDDGHHGHLHAAAVEGEHSHRHRHDPTWHAHPHVPDAHHAHRH